MKLSGLHVGDQVKVVRCAEADLEKYHDKVFTVTEEPWELCGSEEVTRIRCEADGTQNNCFATEFLQRV